MPRRVHDGIRKRCDCSRKNWSKCAHPWHFSFHHQGHEHRYSLDVIAAARHEKPPRDKTTAIAWRDTLRSEIRLGTFIDPTAPTSPTAPDTRLTFGDVCDEYLKRYVRTPTRRAGGKQMMEILIAVARRAEIPAAHGTTAKLEAKPIAGITKADVEAVRTWRRAELAAGRSRPGVKGGESGINRLLARLRHVSTGQSPRAT